MNIGVNYEVGPPDRIQLVVNRGLKSGRLDFHELTAHDARWLALKLLVAAARAEGEDVRL